MRRCALLDNASDLQLVLVTLALMALFSYGGVRGYRAGRRWIRNWRVGQEVRACERLPPLSRVVAPLAGGPRLASVGASVRTRSDAHRVSRPRLELAVP